MNPISAVFFCLISQPCRWFSDFPTMTSLSARVLTFVQMNVAFPNDEHCLVLHDEFCFRAEIPPLYRPPPPPIADTPMDNPRHPSPPGPSRAFFPCWFCRPSPLPLGLTHARFPIPFRTFEPSTTATQVIPPFPPTSLLHATSSPRHSDNSTLSWHSPPIL